MQKILLFFLAMFITGCGVTDLSPSDTYDETFDYSLFSKPVKSQLQNTIDGPQLPNLVSDYGVAKPLFDANGRKIDYDLYLGIDSEESEHFYALRSGCGFDIHAISLLSNISRLVSTCHNFDFGTSKMRDWLTAESDFIITNGKLIYWKQNPFEKRNPYKTGRTWNDNPEIYPKINQVMVNTQTGEKDTFTIEAPTKNRERGADFFSLCFSPDLKYYAASFHSNFVHCYVPFNQGERCDSMNNLIVGEIGKRDANLIFSGEGSFTDNPNHCPVKWDENNNIFFNFNDNIYQSQNIAIKD